MADSCECEHQIARLMRRIERNCEAIGRLMDEPRLPISIQGHQQAYSGVCPAR